MSVRLLRLIALLAFILGLLPLGGCKHCGPCGECCSPCCGPVCGPCYGHTTCYSCCTPYGCSNCQPVAPAAPLRPAVEESRTLKPMPKPPEPNSPPESKTLPDLKTPPAPGAEVPRPASPPELKITKIGPARRHLGKTVEHEIEVHNEGPVAATDVKIVDILPPELAVDQVPEGASVNGQEVTWAIGTLAANESRKVTIRTQAKQISPRTNNRATVRSSEGVGATATAAIEITGTPGVAIEVYDLQDPIMVGQDAEYLLRVVNQGSTRLVDLSLNGECADPLKPIGLIGVSDGGIAGQAVRIPPFDLGLGETKAFRLKVQAVRAADARFRVNLTGPDLDSPVHEEESTTVYEPNAVERASASDSK